MISSLAVTDLHFLPEISFNRGQFQKGYLGRAVHHGIALPYHAPKHIRRSEYLLNNGAGVGKGSFKVIRLKCGYLRADCCFNRLAFRQAGNAAAIQKAIARMNFLITPSC